MKARLKVLLQELDRKDLSESAKVVVQGEIERLLGANAREIFQVLPNETDRRLKQVLVAVEV